MIDLRYYRQAAERRKILESISSAWDSMDTILKVMGFNELMDKKISCSNLEKCLMSYSAFDIKKQTVMKNTRIKDIPFSREQFHICIEYCKQMQDELHTDQRKNIAGIQVFVGKITHPKELIDLVF